MDPRIPQARDSATASRKERKRALDELLAGHEAQWTARQQEVQNQISLGQPQIDARLKLEDEYQVRLGELVQDWNTIRQRQAKELETQAEEGATALAAIVTDYEAAQAKLQEDQRLVDAWWIHLVNEAAVCRMQIDEDEHTALEEIECLDAEAEITAARSFGVGEEVTTPGLELSQDSAPENSQQDDLKVPIGTALPLDSRNIDVIADTTKMASLPTNPADFDDFVDPYSVVKPGAYPAEPADDIDAYSALEAHSADGYSNVEAYTAEPAPDVCTTEATCTAETASSLGASPVLVESDDDDDLGLGLPSNNAGLFSSW